MFYVVFESTTTSIGSRGLSTKRGRRDTHIPVWHLSHRAASHMNREKCIVSSRRAASAWEALRIAHLIFNPGLGVMVVVVGGGGGGAPNVPKSNS